MISDQSVSSNSEKLVPTELDDKSAPSVEPNSQVNTTSDTLDTRSTIVELTEPTEPAAPTEKAAPIDALTVNGTAHELENTRKITELTRQLTEVTKKADNYWDSLLRKQAEYDNLQKRMVRDVDNARKYALEKFATELLSVKDSMELGREAADKPETNLDSVREGMELTLKMLTNTMAKFSINEINPIEEKFNPRWHEAMAMQPVPNAEDGIVLHVHQKGYQLNDRLLRPARVVVAKAIPSDKSL